VAAADPLTPEQLAEGQEATRIALGIRAGERAAESALVKRYSGGLYTILRVRCPDEELCRDLVQDGLRIALVRLRERELSEPAAMAGYLRGIVLNLLANAMRRSETRLTETGSDWLDEVACESSDPFDTVESDDLSRAVREVISSMKVERDRDLLWRHYVQDQPKERLCVEYDLSPEHFDRVLHRARARLRELISARIGRTI